MHGSRPRTEILRREIFAGDVLQVPVDVARIHAPGIAVVIDVLKQFVTGKVAASLDHSGQPAIVDVDRMMDPAFPAELKAHDAATYTDVPVAKRRQSKRSVLPDVLLVPDADEALLEKLHDGRQHLVAREAGEREVRPRATPNARKRFGERLHAIEFRLVAAHAPLSVIAILLAPLRITTGGLKMSAWMRADPDLAPCGRNSQRADAPELRRASDSLPVRADVLETAWPHFAPNSGQTIVDIAQPG